MFDIKLIFLRSESYIATLWICMGSSFFGISRFNNFLLIDATDRSKISSDQKRLLLALRLYPFHFSRTLPLSSLLWNCAKSYQMPVDTNPMVRSYRLICFARVIHSVIQVNFTSILFLKYFKFFRLLKSFLKTKQS